MKTSIALAGLLAAAALGVALTRGGSSDALGTLEERQAAVERALMRVDESLGRIEARSADRSEAPPEALAALAERVSRLERGPAHDGPAQGALPPRAEPAKVAKWLKDLSSPSLDRRFAAASELSKAGALEAVPHLEHVLLADDDFYVRLAAATALGELEAADAMHALIAQLDDRDDLVRTACAEAIHRITGREFGWRSGLTKAQRTALQAEVAAWWRAHRAEVVERLRAKRAPR